jgi:hypothetical protein
LNFRTLVGSILQLGAMPFDRELVDQYLGALQEEPESNSDLESEEGNSSFESGSEEGGEGDPSYGGMSLYSPNPGLRLTPSS